MKRHILLPAAFALGVGLAACQVAHGGHPAPAAGGASPSPSRPAPPQPGFAAIAAAYVKAHPAPHRRHMVAGVVTGEYSDPSTGNWSQTIVTASGKTLTVSCGNPATSVRCSWDGPDPYLAGDGGTYEYVRADGTASRPRDIRVIKRGAV